MTLLTFDSCIISPCISNHFEAMCVSNHIGNSQHAVAIFLGGLSGDNGNTFQYSLLGLVHF